MKLNKSYAGLPKLFFYNLDPISDMDKTLYLLERNFTMKENLPHYFFAIPLPQEIKSLLYVFTTSLKKGKMEFKQWVLQEDYHITLCFLGSSSEQQLESLVSHIQQITSNYAPFSLQLFDIHTFGLTDAPRVLWANVLTGEELFVLQEKVKEACKTVGFRLDERPYTPHITLAKRWTGDALFQINQMPSLNTMDWICNKIMLYQVAPRRIPRYIPVYEFPLDS
ncbi:RNA 2',3'-cyclic phosphodiesterase [Chengkuizengella marina]|uniref:RNA 2',3'-cyclic phosphodiesterase n=1 Tax=Chengkuizengella marina TaxID=2507566 RepID=A0A6N9Q6A2_9BACL|nr:RNA 2',3'-cyclic phosphodiesterase [Chengkuizengella marina]NBI30213.1 RNA 2',3'-cyclic phosphodiesterase [Chengkuizengella marina]